ncbi:MAG: hypothetical protein EBR86_00265 [Planctomycetia bacterium]|nr:hypothetical protein [Planctomycetia bacterium]
MTGRRRFIGGLLAAGGLGTARGLRAAVAEPTLATVIEGIGAAGPLAVTRTGQTLSVLDASRRRVVALDPAEPTKRWTSIEAEGDDGAVLAAMASLDSSTLLAVWQSGDGWSLRVHRVRPPADDTAPAATLQALPLGRAGGPTGRVDLVVSPSRNVVAVAGLPAPLPPLLRGRITGARIDPLSDRRCPTLADRRLGGLAFGPGDEWILLTMPAGAPTAAARLDWFAPGGGHLLDLDTALPGARHAAWDNESGLLYSLAGVPDAPRHPEGLWRVDAVLEQGRQTCRPVCVARLEQAHSLVCLPRHTVVVSQTTGGGRVTRITVPDVPMDAATPGAAAPAE